MNTINLTKSLKTLLGVAVLGLAALTQSFTENVRVEKENKLAGEVWINDSNAGNYSQLPATEPYDPDKCQETNDHNCAYVRTSQPGTVPENFTSDQAEDLEDEGLIEKVDNKTGIYVN